MPDPHAPTELVGGTDHEPLMAQLRRSRELGFLGPGDLGVHVRNARVFSSLLTAQLAPSPLPRSADDERRGAEAPSGDRPQPSVLDLGSGGGVPGLVVAVDLPWLSVTLFDAMEKRCRFLSSAVTELGLGDRVAVVCGRAEVAAHSPAQRARHDAVIARSFGPPAVTVECAAGFLRDDGGRLYVSEPPVGTPDRWPADGLAMLGFALGPAMIDGDVRIQSFDRVTALDDRFPRRDGIPNKRPLF